MTTAQVCNPNCGPSYCRGDLNCSGTVDFGDINPFVLALSDPNAYRAQFPNCPWPQNADINADGAVNFGDINPFVACLSNGGGPCAAHPPHGPCNTVAGPRAEGNVWAGRGTVCNDPNHPACCQIVCDPNMVQEGEPVCANGYVDTFDAGCNSTPASFKTITCGTTVCGNAGTYLDPNHLPVRDTDWYRVVVSSGPGRELHLYRERRVPGPDVRPRRRSVRPEQSSDLVLHGRQRNRRQVHADRYHDARAEHR